MQKQIKYKSLAEIACKYANLLPKNGGICLVRDILRLYPKTANTRPFQEYMTDHVDLITSSEIEEILKEKI
jgi:hypothetical protein